MARTTFMYDPASLPSKTEQPQKQEKKWQSILCTLLACGIAGGLVACIIAKYFLD